MNGRNDARNVHDCRSCVSLHSGSAAFDVGVGAAGGVTAPQVLAISYSLSTELAIAPPGATMLFAPGLTSAAVS
jgi:hypothetical protein